MILTIGELLEICEFAGCIIKADILPYVDDLETMISIEEAEGKKYAYFTEYPDEGAYPLND